MGRARVGDVFHAGVPLCVGSVARHAPIIVWCTVIPPNRPALAECDLRLIDSGSSRVYVGALSLETANHAARIHELTGQCLAFDVEQRGISAAPEPIAHHEIAPVGGHRVAHGHVSRRPSSEP